MVTTAVAILTVLLAQFTYDTKLNKIRIENQIDKVQAKLNAEAGLHYAMSVLKIYQEAWNKLEDNTSAQAAVSPSDLESIATKPFAVPIPVSGDLNIIQKNAISDFEEDSLIQGTMSVAMSSVTGFLNPNNLRVIKTGDDDDNNTTPREGDPLKPHQFIEKTFIEMLESTVQEKIETDEDFALKYSNVDPRLLVKELKYYVSGKDQYDEPEKADIEKNYQNEDAVAKHAAMETTEELYSLAGWDDDLVNVIKDRLSVHNVSVINVNEITINQLKVLFPDLSELQLEEFFKYRDGDEENGTEPTTFKNDKEFKEYLTGKLGAVETAEYDKRIKEFADAQIIIGTGGKLFKVESLGTYGNSTYTITAFIDLPVKPQPPSQSTQAQEPVDGQEPVDDPPENPEGGAQDPKTDSKTYLLRPRVVELRTY